MSAARTPDRPAGVVLHIGLPKTGSTAVQNWGRANRRALAADGVFVLPAVMEAHRLAVECIDDEKRLQSQDVANIRALPFAAASEALLAGLKGAGVRSACVSSEYFYLAEPARVAELFAGLGVPVARVLCFVRRQDDLMASGYNQDVKGMGSSRPFVAPGYRRGYDWCALRDDWQAAFPAAHIVLHNFDFHRARGTLVDVYARAIGAGSVHAAPKTDNTNESLGAELLEIVRVANAEGLPQLARLAVEAQQGGLGGTPFAFAAPLRRAILEAYAESNARLAEDDPDGEFADFASAGRAREGIDLTGIFPERFALRFMAWLGERRG
ncbi:MAG: hypothetical protein CALGDGBN_01211 [Pseudomonadales bacterium]|nr:hypothetical protein [Pseudomonadales bacterium]